MEKSVSGYQWSCNEWRNNENSDNSLPNIVEGPGSETADSSSYHSDDSSDHKKGKDLLNPNIYTEETFGDENYPNETSKYLIIFITKNFKTHFDKCDF